MRINIFGRKQDSSLPHGNSAPPTPPEDDVDDVSPTDLMLNDFKGHVWILGKTGGGKTNTLIYLLRRLIEPENQKEFPCACIFIDPHGEASIGLARVLNEWQGPNTRLIILNPEIVSFGINPLALPDDKRDRIEIVHDQVGHVSSILVDVLNTDSANAPRLTWIFKGALYYLYSFKEANPTFRDLYFLLEEMISTGKSDKDKVRGMLKNRGVEDAVVQKTIQAIAELPSDAYMPIMNRIFNFVAGGMNSRTFCCRDSTIDFTEIMKPGTTTIFSFPKIPDDDFRKLVMSLVTINIFHEVQKQYVSSRKTHVILAMDEFQQIGKLSVIGTILSEARKFGLFLYVAHQNLELLEKPLINSLSTNAGMVITHQLGPDDAGYIAKVIEPLNAAVMRDEISALTQHHCRVRKNPIYSDNVMAINMTFPKFDARFPPAHTEEAVTAFMRGEMEHRFGGSHEATDLIYQMGEQDMAENEYAWRSPITWELVVYSYFNPGEIAFNKISNYLYRTRKWNTTHVTDAFNDLVKYGYFEMRFDNSEFIPRGTDTNNVPINRKVRPEVRDDVERSRTAIYTPTAKLKGFMLSFFHAVSPRAGGPVHLAVLKKILEEKWSVGAYCKTDMGGKTKDDEKMDDILKCLHDEKHAGRQKIKEVCGISLESADKYLAELEKRWLVRKDKDAKGTYSDTYSLTKAGIKKRERPDLMVIYPKKKTIEVYPLKRDVPDSIKIDSRTDMIVRGEPIIIKTDDPYLWDYNAMECIEIEANPSKDPEHVYKNYLKNEALGKITFVVTMEEHEEIIRSILTRQHDIPESTPEHDGKYEIRYVKFQSLNDKPESTALEEMIIYEKAQMFRAKGYAENAIFAILAGRSNLDLKEVRKIILKTIDAQKEINKKIELLKKVGCSERMIKDFYGKLYSEEQIKMALDVTANTPPATSLGEKVAAYKEMGYTGGEMTTLLTPEYGLNEVKQAIGTAPQTPDAAPQQPAGLSHSAEPTLQKPRELQKAESPAPKQPVEKKEAFENSPTVVEPSTPKPSSSVTEQPSLVATSGTSQQQQIELEKSSAEQSTLQVTQQPSPVATPAVEQPAMPEGEQLVESGKPKPAPVVVTAEPKAAAVEATNGTPQQQTTSVQENDETKKMKAQKAILTQLYNEGDPGREGLAEVCGISMSSVKRYLADLEKRGIVQKDGKGTYSLTARTIERLKD